MRYLITGGAGFIGSNFIYYLLEKYPEHEIVCVDSLTYAGNLKTLDDAYKIKNFHFLKADISDMTEIKSLFDKERPDVVVNFAAESHVDRSIEMPEVFLKTNILGTQVLMDCCLKYGVSRFHQVSTDEVYGELPIEDKALLFTEESPLKPSSPYSASKASADMLALAYHRTYQLPVTVSRCSNNYGPFHFPEKLIPLVITRALYNHKIPVYGKGENIRDWLYVFDHCTAIDIIIHKGKAGQVYNIGSRSERTNLQVVKEILKLLGKPESLIEYVKDRPGHDLRYAIDPYKIESELGWTPKYSFGVGLKDTVDWFLSHQTWWTEVINGEYKNYYERFYGNKT